MTGIERFLEIMDAPAEITEKENADELKNVQGNITFENVGFHYSDDDTNVLSNINLNIKKRRQRCTCRSVRRRKNNAL